ncbi:MAG TPA: DNRLRE domain-containing protein, partial [Candidatus Atribacteria bacterium]|nr:DNRLRE domain-containing protein [Candidatus Atribacteria bacterium]
FKYFSLFFAMTVLLLVVGCSGTTPTTTTGSIDINSYPDGAEVYLDGVDTGQVTPIILTNIDAGTHTVTLDKFHYKIWEDTAVIVNANQTTYLNPALTYASTESITLQPGPEGKDTGIESANPTNNYALWPFTGIGNSDSTIIRMYIEFDLSSIPENARVVDADLKLYQFDSLGTDNFTIGLYKITSTWDESTIDWDPQPSSSTDAEITSSINAGATTWESWDIDTLVQGWLDGTIPNYGMMLKDLDESSVNTIAYFYTSDYTVDTTKRPKLEIDYYIP